MLLIILSTSQNSPNFLPTPIKNTAHTRTTFAETHTLASNHNQATAVSAITEDLVSTAVKTCLQELDASRQDQTTAFQDRLNSLEDTIATIHSTVDSISSKMAGDVLDLLMAPNGILTQQNAKLDAQSLTIDRLVVVLETLTTDVKRLGTATEAMASHLPTPASPPHQHKKQKALGARASADDDNPMQQE
jgi:uncharacterized coiled-coil protein SlyX